MTNDERFEALNMKVDRISREVEKLREAAQARTVNVKLS
jgi:hypothetical protein